MTKIFSSVSVDDFYPSRGATDIRLRDLVSDIDSSEFCILGYPDDEGIALNSGRPGAKEGPDGIRSIFYRMTPPWWYEKDLPRIYDLGNLQITNEIDKRHSEAAQFCKNLLKTHKVISFGGGHDYAYPDGAGFLSAFEAEDRPLIINIDAHLDVRDTSKGLSSGTPFYRLLNEFENFDLLEIGIQAQCNTKTHAKWALEKGVHILSYEQIAQSGSELCSLVLERYPSLIKHNRKCFLSLDIDAFASCYAPGCSQSWPTGLAPNDFFKLFKYLNSILDIKILGIYEVSPPLDSDLRTQRLAAQCAYSFIFDE